MAARIEEPDSLTAARINPSQVRTFVVVIREAGEREVGGDGPTAMLLSDDMVYLESSR